MTDDEQPKKPLFEAGEDPDLDAQQGEGTQARIHVETKRRVDEYLRMKTEGRVPEGYELSAEEKIEIERRENKRREDSQITVTKQTIERLAQKLGKENPLTGQETLDNLILIKDGLLKEWQRLQS